MLPPGIVLGVAGGIDNGGGFVLKKKEQVSFTCSHPNSQSPLVWHYIVVSSH